MRALSAQALEIDAGFDPAVGRAVFASLRPVHGQPGPRRRRHHRAAAGVLAARACGSARPMPADAGFHRARAHDGVSARRACSTPERLSSLRFLQISGSACPPELAQAVQALMPNGKVTQLWGMSELQAGAYQPAGRPASTRASNNAGRASPGTELRVMPTTRAAPAGEEGELQVRGCSVFDGYLEQRRGDRSRVHRRRLVPHRRSRAHGCRRQHPHHRAAEGSHQSRRGEIQSGRYRGADRSPRGGRCNARSRRCPIRSWASAPAASRC